MLNNQGVLDDNDRVVHEAITALIEELGAVEQSPRHLESLLHRVASIQGRLNYLDTSVRAAWELSLGEEGMSESHVAYLKAQMRGAVNS